MTERPIPKRGDRFVHKHWLDATLTQHDICRITAVRQGVVYYRTDDGDGMRFYVKLADIDASVKEWL